MDTGDFLARIVAPGSFYATSSLGDKGRMSTRFFPRGEGFAPAVGFIRWCQRKSRDIWFCPSSYKIAELDGTDGIGKQQYKGERTQQNAQNVRALWYDADVSRPGDGKAPGKAFATRAEALDWLKSFAAATHLRPSLIVNSGYGYHVYWIFEGSLPVATWQPLAYAFVSALKAHHAKGDIGLAGDAARLLRIPGTSNFKVRGSPQPVTVVAAAADIPNELIVRALTPYQSVASAQAANYGSIAGTPPSIASSRPGMVQAAQANMPTSRRPHSFSRIATQCEQAKQSLATGGNGDDYNLWHLGWMSLAAKCDDGRGYAHLMSQGDPRYTVAQTDAAFDRAEQEQIAKDLGAPTCAMFDTWRSGVCQTCAHYARVVSPYSLGVEDNDLPSGYRRHAGSLQYYKSGDGEDDDSNWLPFVKGDVGSPVLDEVSNSFRLTYQYILGNKTYILQARTREMSSQLVASRLHHWCVPIDDSNAKHWDRFLMAWITKLREAGAVREEAIPSFGWASDKGGNHYGFAVGGTVYRHDGSEEVAPGAPAEVIEQYKPRGRLEVWQQVCALVTKNRVDLQIVVAAAFGAPLLTLTGETGVTISAWSGDSAQGKTSAMRTGATVWGSLDTMHSYDDTRNAIRSKIGHTHVMPCYWDEVRLDKKRDSDLISMFFTLTQGRDKARLNADSSHREVNTWRTLLIAAGNRSFQKYITQTDAGEAGAVRVFEYRIKHPKVEHDPVAAKLIAQCESNYGHAGRIYAKWLGQNRAVADDYVTRWATVIQQKTQAERAERLLVAGAASVVTGAAIANKLGLTSFDLKAMLESVCYYMIALREDRAEHGVYSLAGLKIDEIMMRFWEESTPRRLVTRFFKGRGPASSNYDKLKWPLIRDTLWVHVGHLEAEARINKRAFGTWLYEHGLDEVGVMEEMAARYGAQLKRREALGAATDWATNARIPVIVLPLRHPDLVGYKDETTTDVAPATGDRP